MIKDTAQRVIENVGQVIVGKEEVVELVLTHLRRAGLIDAGADEPGRAPHSEPPSP